MREKRERDGGDERRVEVSDVKGQRLLGTI